MGTTRIEVERLKTLIQSMSQLSYNSIALLRDQLRSIKEGATCDKSNFAAEFQKIENTWSTIKDQSANHERELINRLTVDHELELNDIRKSITAKDDEIAALTCDNRKLLEKLANAELDIEKSKKQTSIEFDSLKTRIAELEQQVGDYEADKMKAVNEIKDKLNREHKTDIESLRCRYKLMKNMDRSPSDTSLEKIDRAEFIDYERSGGRSTLLASSPKSPTSSQSLYRKILDEKERQLDASNNQVQILTKENTKFKEIINSLNDYEQQQPESLTNLKEQVEALQKDKLKLKQKLNLERSRRMELSAIDKYVKTDCSSLFCLSTSSILLI